MRKEIFDHHYECWIERRRKNGHRSRKVSVFQVFRLHMSDSRLKWYLIFKSWGFNFYKLYRVCKTCARVYLIVFHGNVYYICIEMSEHSLYECVFSITYSRAKSDRMTKIVNCMVLKHEATGTNCRHKRALHSNVDQVLSGIHFDKGNKVNIDFFRGYFCQPVCFFYEIIVIYRMSTISNMCAHNAQPAPHTHIVCIRNEVAILHQTGGLRAFQAFLKRHNAHWAVGIEQ